MNTSHCPRCGNVIEETDHPCPRCFFEDTPPCPEKEPEQAQEPSSARSQEGGVVLKLVPKTPLGGTESQRSVCRRILLDTLQRVENGEVDEIFLVTINSRQAPSPATYRWHFTDPIRITGALTVAATKFSMPPFVVIT